MAVVRIPSLLQSLTGGTAVVELPGHTVREVFDALDRAYPGIGARLMEDGQLRPELAVGVDGEIAPLGLLQPVRDDSEIVIMPAVGGG
jgi:molybdopterin synthase sulfur carrier subunit